MSDPEDQTQGSAAPITDKPWHKLHIWQIQAVRDVLFGLAAFGLFVLGSVLQSITVPILVALGLAYLFEPLIRWTGARYPWATRLRMVIAVMVMLLLFLGTALAILVPTAIGQTSALVSNLPSHIRSVRHYVASEQSPRLVREWCAQSGIITIEEVDKGGDAAATTDDQGGTAEAGGEPAPASPDAAVEDSGSKPEPVPAPVAAVTQSVQEDRIRAIVRDELEAKESGPPRSLSAIGKAAGAVGTFLVSAVTSLLDLVFTLFLVCFFFVVFSTTYPDVVQFGDSLLPASRKDRLKELIGKMDEAVSGFVRGRLLIALILGGVFAVGWTICGVPYAIVLGLVIGVFTLVPYLSGIGLPIAWVLLFMQTIGGLHDGGFYTTAAADGTHAVSWWKILLFPGIVFVVAQILDDYVLSPIIQGRATNLSPAAIVVAVLAGGSLAGLYGMLLAIPAAACIRILLVDVLMPRVNAWLAGERADPLPISR